MEEPKITTAVTEEAPTAEEQTSHGTNRGLKVVVAIDESEGSLNALAWALDHLDFLNNNNSLTLVHVQQLFQHFIFPSGPTVYATTSVVESIKSAQEQNTNTLLATALKLCEEKGVQADTLITDGDPKEVICEAAEQTHADLLIVGSRGLSKFKRAFLGSVSDYIAHHAKCPVLIVKPQK